MKSIGKSIQQFAYSLLFRLKYNPCAITSSSPPCSFYFVFCSYFSPPVPPSSLPPHLQSSLPLCHQPPRHFPAPHQLSFHHQRRSLLNRALHIHSIQP